MKKIISAVFIGLSALLVSSAPVFADSTETKSTWYCYTNAYGQESCTEKKEETTKFEKVVVRELTVEEATIVNEKAAAVVAEQATVNEHKVLDTALDPTMTVASILTLSTALAGVAYKFKKAD